MSKRKPKVDPPKDVSSKMNKAIIRTVSLERCSWVPLKKDYYVDYHDVEWGVPVYNSKKLFEMLNLEGAQAGLSWDTILFKRENYRKAFANFEPEEIVKFDEVRIQEILGNPGIVRNKLKVNAVYKNAQAFLKIEEKQPFSEYIWSFTEGRVIQNSFRTMSEVPDSTEISERMSKQLKKDGFKFVGPKICYAFMQAVGIVNDHTVNCFRYQELTN